MDFLIHQLYHLFSILIILIMRETIINLRILNKNHRKTFYYDLFLKNIVIQKLIYGFCQ